MKKTIRISILLIFFLQIMVIQHLSAEQLTTNLSEDEELESELRWLQAETMVITASKIWENITKTAASISVITDEDIRRMGARHLMDVLQTIPGMSYRYNDSGQVYTIDSRGMEKQGSQNILIMLNGQALNDLFLGGATWTMDTLILDNVKRIEVIRGPGSALYGANAFSGVINIITKNGEDIDGIDFSASTGSFNTQQYNLLYGDTLTNDIQFAMNVNYLDSDGFRAYIEKDYQTELDRLFNIHASQAPGKARAHDQKYDIELFLKKEDIQLNGRYIDRNKQAGPFLSYALNQFSQINSADYSMVLSYDHDFADTWNCFAKVYRTQNDLESMVQIIPPGGAAPSPLGIQFYPQGMNCIPASRNTRTGIESHIVNSLGQHTLLFGLNWENMKQDDVTYQANFLYTSMQQVVMMLPEMIDLSESQNYNKNISRQFKALFGEDLWNISSNLRLALGARYDDYSDFGGSFNPRAGLIWEYLPDYDIKLLYGRAFRAPNFYELYSENNPSLFGNPNLKPETVDTYELSFGASLNPYFSGRVTGFYNLIKKEIGPEMIGLNQIYQNRGRLRSQGIETEFKLHLTQDNYLNVNFTYQDITHLDLDDEIWNLPTYKGNIIANVQFSSHINWLIWFYVQAGFTREKDDPRPDNHDFGVFNTTVIVSNFPKIYQHMEFRCSVFNLLDKEYTFPINKDTLPGDHPMPGINGIIELSIQF
ncbi:MAG: TonB-dependent receptor [Desulfobacterales bacterium]|nr:TonB-dependent receptor [Desulfobacterales bacterium]